MVQDFVHPRYALVVCKASLLVLTQPSTQRGASLALDPSLAITKGTHKQELPRGTGATQQWRHPETETQNMPVKKENASNKEKLPRHSNAIPTPLQHYLCFGNQQRMSQSVEGNLCAKICDLCGRRSGLRVGNLAATSRRMLKQLLQHARRPGNIPHQAVQILRAAAFQEKSWRI